MDPFSDQRKKVQILQSIFPDAQEEELLNVLVSSDGCLITSCNKIIQKQGEKCENLQSLVELYRENEGQCYYCRKNPLGNAAYGINSTKMQVEIFQELLDRGWARSGNYIYLPSNHRNCCPTYALRLDTNKFVMKKSHKRALARFERFIQTGSCDTPSEQLDKKMKLKTKIPGENYYKETIKNSLKKLVNENNWHDFINENQINALDFDIQFCKINKKIRRELSTNIGLKLKSNYFRESKIDIANKLSLQLPESWGCIVTGQGFINFNAKSTTPTQLPKHHKKINKKETDYQEKRPPAHHFEVTLEEPILTEEKYRLYVKYQTTVHNANVNEVLKEGFNDFLCASPLIKKDVPGGPPDLCFGSYHQLYRLDGKLIAIGILDVLPYCLSSIYFIYDPDYSFLNIGIVSSLMEIKWVQEISANFPQLHYYYLGYYVASCSKVQYKLNYEPSYLLCSETLQWVPVEQALRILKQNKYGRFANEEFEKQPPEFSEETLDIVINEFPISISGSKYYLSELENDQGKIYACNTIKSFIRVAGPDIASRVIYVFSN